MVAQFCDAGEERRVAHGVEHDVAGSARNRVAAVGGPVRARHQRRTDFVGGQHRREREATADAFGKRHCIRFDVLVFIREQAAGASHAGLHLVKQHQAAVFGAKLAHRAEVTGRRHANTAFALNWLEQHCRGPLGHRRFQRVEVSERNVANPRQQRLETDAVLFLARHCDHAEGAAMKTAVHCNDFEAPLTSVVEVATSKFDHRFVCFGARVREEHFFGE